MTFLLSLAFVLGVLIFVHELGHFITAKMVGIKVERFSLGFPPRAFGFQYGDTDYCISWVPVGGYVKMAGMIDETMDDTITGASWEFASKPVWQRIIVISAGSFMNIVLAVVIYTGITYFTGLPHASETTAVGQVLNGTPAEAIGLQAGDVITIVSGQTVDTWQDLTTILHASPQVEVDLEWRRGDETMSAKVTPELQPDNKGRIGIAPIFDYRPATFSESLEHGVISSYTVLKMTAQVLKLILTGKESFRNAVGGPIAIAKFAGESAKRGFDVLLATTALISLNLAFFNMLPFPVLDGGHLVLLLIEGVMRKPLPSKTRLFIQKIGIAFLLALMVFILINDVTRWRWGKLDF
ncbi:MAG: RIP metalloprotease RseP [bacterium]